MTIRMLALVAVLVGISAPQAAVASGRETLQRDVNALRATGATGVLAEVSGSRHPLAARAGVADPATDEPVPWHAKHRIASTTKTFVATVVLQLAGEGAVGLDDTVERWLPGLVAANGNDGTKITVRASHRTGACGRAAPKSTCRPTSPVTATRPSSAPRVTSTASSAHSWAAGC